MQGEAECSRPKQFAETLQCLQQVIYSIKLTLSFPGETLMISSGSQISRKQKTYCELSYVPLGHQVMLVLWSDAVTYPLQHTSPQQVSGQPPPKSGETHSHFKCANGRASREETAKSRQAGSKVFKTVPCPKKPRVSRHLGVTPTCC